MPNPSPRKRLRMRTWVDWQDRLMSDATRAQDVADAIQTAFCRTVFEAVAEARQLANESEERPRGTQADHVDRLAAVVGMSRTTLENTKDGRRWVRLPEVAALAAAPGLGPAFLGHLGRLLAPLLGVLHSTQDSGLDATNASNSPRVEGMSNNTLDRLRPAVPAHEDMARDVIERLAMIQSASVKRRLSPVGTVDWRGIRLQVSGPPRPIREWGGRNEVLREAGVENLTALLRSTVAVRKDPFTVHALHKRVSQSYPRLTERQVRDGVRRLKRAGELESPSRGVYVVTERLRERVTR